MWRAARSLMQGDLDRAAALTAEALRIGQRTQAHVDVAPMVEQTCGLQQVFLARERGRFADVEPMIKATVEALPTVRGWRAGLALLYADTGRTDDARREFEALAVDGFTSFRRDGVWFNAMASLSTVCAELGDADRAAQLYELIRPYATSHVVIGWANAYMGSFAHYLGHLASTMEHFDVASEHFEDAMDAQRLLGATPWVARTEYYYAEMLYRRGRQADRWRAGQMVSSALTAARAVGMERLAERAQALAREEESTGLQPGWTSPAGKGTGANCGGTLGTFLKEGDYWTIASGSETVRLRDAKGLRYLDQLLCYPGRQVHVLELVAAIGGTRSQHTSGQTAQAGLQEEHVSSPERLGAEARAAYRTRIVEIEEELPDAEARGAHERAADLREEQQLLAAELSRSLGLRGERRPSPEVERARVAVTNALRRTIRRLRTEAPVLAGHFERAVTTGVFCSYGPAPDDRISWRP